MKYLFLNDENIDVYLPPYLRINMKIWLKRQIQDFDTSCQQYICYVSIGFNTIQKNQRDNALYGGRGGGAPYIPFTSRSAVLLVPVNKGKFTFQKSDWFDRVTIRDLCERYSLR